MYSETYKTSPCRSTTAKPFQKLIRYPGSREHSLGDGLRPLNIFLPHTLPSEAAIIVKPDPERFKRDSSRASLSCDPVARPRRLAQRIATPVFEPLSPTSGTTHGRTKCHQQSVQDAARGRLTWQNADGYSLRSLVETAMSRLKRRGDDRLAARAVRSAAKGNGLADLGRKSTFSSDIRRCPWRPQFSLARSDTLIHIIYKEKNMTKNIKIRYQGKGYGHEKKLPPLHGPKCSKTACRR